MNNPFKEEKLIQQNVTYTLFKDGKFFIIENVPARVDRETGEQYFAPHVVEKLQQIILQQQAPARVIQTPVYEFA
ncbi:hypothetical protein EDS67_09525 [candidate division KSB1 bacterium]|nr:MAG: hypothetical protein EDS67_09525 [candidate division KSB1 bacterium]MBC6948392.1 hypothetical protein [candidate division KSB1 bacterium]MCE7943933.1 hypothetical protein [Chlorobi bacterium CHB1]MDL1878415.1 hypothetical protein [Cytophagia bacterium CHB2]RIK73971.1 MAG: hypothetical protein DCC62_16215 [candidate division KSB1 bacterium]